MITRLVVAEEGPTEMVDGLSVLSQTRADVSAGGEELCAAEDDDGMTAEEDDASEDGDVATVAIWSVVV